MADVIIIANKRQQPKCLSTDKYVRIFLHIHTREARAAMKEHNAVRLIFQ